MSPLQAVEDGSHDRQETGQQKEPEDAGEADPQRTGNPPPGPCDDATELEYKEDDEEQSAKAEFDFHVFILHGHGYVFITV